MSSVMPISSQIDPSQSKVCKFISIVRLALVTSVTCVPPLMPPVRFQISQVSMVPNSAMPFSAAARTSGILSSNQRTLGPEK